MNVDQNNENKYLKENFEENKGQDERDKRSNGAYAKHNGDSNKENINGIEFINNGNGIDYYYDNDDSNVEFSSHNDIDVVQDGAVKINYNEHNDRKDEFYK